MAIFHNVATVGLNSLRSICPSMVLDTPVCSAAIIWQAADAAGANPHQIAGWLTMLGLAMGISPLGLTLWYRAPILTAWSTPGAALLATSLPGYSLSEAVGILFSPLC